MITLIFCVISAILDSQRDTIQYAPLATWFPFWRWWTVRNYMEKKFGGSWVFDTVLSFANDGWHFCKTLSLLSLFFGVVLYSPMFGLWDVVIFWAVYSVAFEVGYTKL